MRKLVEALLAREANPNARLVKALRMPGTSGPRFNMIGATPFLLATASLDIDLMRLLVENGASALLGTEEKVTPLMVAAGLGSFYDRTEDDKKVALEVAKLTIELGGDVNAVGESGWTALHGATYGGNDAIVQLLVDKGAKLDIKDEWEQTPLSIAQGLISSLILNFTKKSYGPHTSTANLLLKLGATPPNLDAPPWARSDAGGCVTKRESVESVTIARSEFRSLSNTFWGAALLLFTESFLKSGSRREDRGP